MFDDENDQTWEASQQIRDDAPGLLEGHLHTSGHKNLKREILDLYFRFDINIYLAIHIYGSL